MGNLYTQSTVIPNSSILQLVALVLEVKLKNRFLNVVKEPIFLFHNLLTVVNPRFLDATPFR